MFAAGYRCGGNFNLSMQIRTGVIHIFAAVSLLAMAGVAPPAWGVMIFEESGQWLDTDGHFINAHGAGVLFHDGEYYLYGEIKKGKTKLVPGQDWEDYRVDAGGVSCYSSRDLVHWKNEGVALAPNPTDTASDLYIGRVVERPKVIYNRSDATICDVDAYRPG